MNPAVPTGSGRVTFPSGTLTKCVAMTPVWLPPLPRSLFLGRCSSTPPVPCGRRRRRGRGHVKNGALPHGRADIVQVYAQHDQYGVEGKAETEGPDAGAAQEEAEPVDQPAGGDRESLVPV